MARVPQGTADETARILRLQEEYERLEAAVAPHAVVDRAIGVMPRGGRSVRLGGDLLAQPGETAAEQA